MINPPGAYHNGVVNENLTPVYTKLGMEILLQGLQVPKKHYWFAYSAFGRRRLSAADVM